MKKLPFYDFQGNVIIRTMVGPVFLPVYGAGRYSVDGRIMKDATVRTLGRKILEEHDFRPNTGMLKASHVYSQTMHKRYYDAEGIVC